MAVRVERSGPITTVVLSRPEVRNAVDRQTAEELAQAFRAFDADDEALVGVLAGDDGPVLCGRRSQGIRRWHAESARTDGRRADGADAPAAEQAGHRRHRGLRGRGRARARALVRSARDGGGRGAGRLLPTLGRAAHRRRHRALAPAHWAESRARPRSSPAARSTRERRWQWGSPTGSSHTGRRARLRRRWRAIWRPFPRSACVRIASRRTSSSIFLSARRWRTNSRMD